MDLLVIADGQRLGFEIKYTASPRMTRSMRAAIDNLGLDRLFVVYPGDRRLPLTPNVEAIALADLVQAEIA
jgi:hypothetical protein